MEKPVPEDIRLFGIKLARILNLESSPVGVRLITSQMDGIGKAKHLSQHRYCQALMLARRGQEVYLSGKEVNCPAAAAAFGFRTLPEGLQSGKGLVGFGIVRDPEVGKQMFAQMPYLKPDSILGLHLFPLEQAEQIPDVVIIEGEVEKLMWVNLAYLNATGGKRLVSSTAILQATCVDSTIVPYLENKLNFGYGCYGCRDATDLAASETVVGFPVAILASLVENLEYLAVKAIPTSRAKKALAGLRKKINSE